MEHLEKGHFTSIWKKHTGHKTNYNHHVPFMHSRKKHTHIKLHSIQPLLKSNTILKQNTHFLRAITHSFILECQTSSSKILVLEHYMTNCSTGKGKFSRLLGPQDLFTSHLSLLDRPMVGISYFSSHMDIKQYIFINCFFLIEMQVLIKCRMEYMQKFSNL